MTNPEAKSLLSVVTESEREIHLLLDMFPTPVLICRDGRVSRANAKAAECFAAVESRVLEGRTLASLVQRTGSKTGQSTCILHRFDGTRGNAELAVSGDDAAESIVVLNERPPVAEATRFARLATAIFDTTDEAMLITDERQIILSVNPAFERVTGYSAAEALGQTPRLLSSGRHDQDFYTGMWETLLQDGHWHGEIWNRRKSGELYVQRITLSVLRDGDGRATNYVAIFSDITSSKREADRLRHLVHHDSLTRLPNRVLLLDRTEQALAQAARNGSQAALLFLDLDGFKGINDRLGHLAGDHVLEAVADRLSGCIRGSDTVARLGGDEFVILLPVVKSLRDVEKLAAKLLAALSEPVVLTDGQAKVGISVGVALYPRDGDDSDGLLVAADEAMYRAKRLGGNQVAYAGRN